ncbi:hypothetical protein [Taibaiella soli]|uniref:Uncharacterized protein n=1 Tax=Taibaiella soli TaxID=1649169 RepID=A0A2W2BCH5_9BACT|nr:hypothetical protein [Taibaiella soli]PZF73929.1 hypothetical protein DN068_06205 [Taibaiella soli]
MQHKTDKVLKITVEKHTAITSSTYWVADVKDRVIIDVKECNRNMGKGNVGLYKMLGNQLLRELEIENDQIVLDARSLNVKNTSYVVELPSGMRIELLAGDVPVHS